MFIIICVFLKGQNILIYMSFPPLTRLLHFQKAYSSSAPMSQERTTDKTELTVGFWPEIKVNDMSWQSEHKSFPTGVNIENGF